MHLAPGFFAAQWALAALVLTYGSASSPAPDARAREVARLRSHFDSVSVEMASAPAMGLNAAQRVRRALLVAELQRYRDAGEFPRNHDFAGRAVPYFVDEKTGAICAVGHLLATSGRRDIVDRVSATNNNVLVAQLADDAEFRAWLDSTGVTLAEAGRIQVPYVGDGPGNGGLIEGPPPGSVSMGYVAGSAAASGASLAAAMWNATVNKSGRSRLANFVGMGSGIIAIGSSFGGGSTAAAPVTALRLGSFAAGAASTLLGARGLQRHRLHAQREASLRRATVAPVVSAEGAGGVAVSIRF